MDHPILFVVAPPREFYRSQALSRCLSSTARPKTGRLLVDHHFGPPKLPPDSHLHYHIGSRLRRSSSGAQKKERTSPLSREVGHLGQLQESPFPWNSGVNGDNICHTSSTTSQQNPTPTNGSDGNQLSTTAYLDSSLTLPAQLNDIAPNSNQSEFQSKLVYILKHLGFISDPSKEPIKMELSGDFVGHGRPASPDSGRFSMTTECSLKQSVDNCGLISLSMSKDGKRSTKMNSEVVLDIRSQFDSQLHLFIRHRLQSYLHWSLDVLDVIASVCLQGLVLQAYDLSHDLVVTPKRLDFTRTQEAKLYEKLLENARKRHPAIGSMVTNTLAEMRQMLPEMAAEDLDFTQSMEKTLIASSDVSENSNGQCMQQQLLPSIEPAEIEPTSGGHSPGQFTTAFRETKSHSTQIQGSSYANNSPEVKSVQEQPLKSGKPLIELKDYRNAEKMVREYVFQMLTNVIAARLLDCMEVMRQSCVGTLERTIANLERLGDDELSARRTSSCPFLDRLTVTEDPDDYESPPHTPDIQKSDSPQSTKPRVSFLSDLSTGYRTTEGYSAMANEARHMAISRLFDSTEPFRRISRTRRESFSSEKRSTGAALKSLLTFTYDMTVPLSKSLGSQLTGVFDRLREVFVNPLAWKSTTELDKAWIIRTARSVLNGLCETTITRKLCMQITDKLRQSHHNFLSKLRRLQVQTEIRICRFEEAQETILRQYAPRLARVVLETSSLRTCLHFGLPSLGKELGRGQYGVVYTCANWGGLSHLAIKSVVPPDDKHWKDLALEIFYSKQIPPHDRIVSLHASVIDYDHARGSQPAVLLVMERLVRDLHMAIKQGLLWLRRLLIARDVAEGMRYLHNQGMVHRDIKPRNVLLDLNDRAKLTDLGFCKPQAMIGGSILGTPMHMAPEIFEQHYDSSVDIYAFGILFWYICAGRVHMPKNFEQCGDKDVLWHAVRKGVRPERLKLFTNDCWNLMEQCWSRNPRKRPHSGQLVAALEQIYEDETARLNKPTTTNHPTMTSSLTS